MKFRLFRLATTVAMLAVLIEALAPAPSGARHMRLGNHPRVGIRNGRKWS
jgi:hypothetical protein